MTVKDREPDGVGVLEIVKEIVGAVLSYTPTGIAADDFLVDELGADLCDCGEIVKRLEERFCLKLPDNLESAATVADLAAGVRGALLASNKGSAA